jgi:hypothetical protein
MCFPQLTPLTHSVQSLSYTLPSRLSQPHSHSPLASAHQQLLMMQPAGSIAHMAFVLLEYISTLPLLQTRSSHLSLS